MSGLFDLSPEEIQFLMQKNPGLFGPDMIPRQSIEKPVMPVIPKELTPQEWLRQFVNGDKRYNPTPGKPIPLSTVGVRG